MPEKSCLSDSQKFDCIDLLQPNDDPLSACSNRIDALYLCLETLGEPKTMEDAVYYSRPQIGGSCSVSPLWVLSKLTLSENSVAELENDTKFKSLMRNYKLIKNGQDQSSTRKIMVLDQVQSLMHIHKDDAKAVKVLRKIQSELMTSGISRVESKVTGGVELTSYLGESVNGVRSMQPLRAKLTPKGGKLELDVQWKQDSKSPIHYQFKEVSAGNFEGHDLADALFLLYFSVAKGDQQASEAYIQQVLSKLAVEGDLQKRLDIHNCLMGLVKDLSTSNTHSDIAKKYCLVRLMQVNNPQFDLRSLANQYLPNYKAMAVEAHLGADNIWVNVINKLEGNVEVQFKLGQALWMRENYSGSIKYLKFAADQGDMKAQVMIGQAFDKGAVDLDTAIKYTAFAAAKDNEAARVQLEHLIALSDLSVKALDGDIDAQVEVGEQYFIRGHYNEALKYFKMAADGGDVRAQSKMIALHRKGALDLGTAREYMHRAAQQGDATSQFGVGQELWMKGSFLESVKYFKPAADKGDKEAQFKMGAAFSKGVVDLETAIKYTEMAVKQDHPSAQDQLDHLNESKERSVQANAQLERLQNQGKEQGGIEGQFRRGQEHWEKGNFAEAIKYFQRAADQGDMEAQYMMGLAFNKGVLDLDTAIKYTEMSVEQGYDKAQAQLNLLNQMKERSEKAKAQLEKLQRDG